MKEKIEQLVGYVQERCLWQFYSRTWDRNENIEGIMTKVAQLLAGDPLKKDTPMDRCFYADAMVVSEDFKARYPWVKELSKEEIYEVIEGVKARMTEIVVTKSQNEELNIPFY